MKHPRFDRLVRAAVLLAAAALLLAAPLAASAAMSAEGAANPAAAKAADDAGSIPAGALPTISLTEVQRGQRGYGLSVFAGTEPERFDVEVIGVMRNVAPDVSYILARLTGHDLEKSGVPGGMSGSPVFLDGRLAGAVAFSWPFTNEAIAGITPIESMRKLSGLKGLPVSPAPTPIKLTDLLAGRMPQDLLAAQWAKLMPRFAEGATSAVEWTASGFGERSQGVLRQVLGSLSSAGKAEPGAVPDDLAPGKSVAVVLVDGDFQLAATGTVTDRYGDQVLAFGHPFLGLGPMRAPMATSEVVTVLSSQNSSFKISNVGRIVGAFEQDRKMGILGRVGAQAPMVPMVLKIDGERRREFRMRLADIPEFMPLLVGSTVLAGLEAASYTTGPQSLDMTAHLRLQRHGELEVRQSFDGDSAGTEAAAFLLTIVAYLSQNNLEKVDLQDVEVELAQSQQPRFATLVGANANRTVVRPGDRVALNLDLVAYRGDRFRHSLSLDLPEDLPAGRYSLLVGDGASVDAARLALEPAEPETFPQALNLLRSFHSRRDLMVLGIYGGPGLSVAGEVMPRLPGSVRSLWGAAASGSATALRTTVAQERREALDLPMQGMVKIDLEVRRREPLAGDGEVKTEEGNGEVAATVPSPPRPSSPKGRGGSGTSN
jgi:SpoIVB peptidase S55